MSSEEFPSGKGSSKMEPQLLSMDQVPRVLIPMINPLARARIIFDGFTLPEEFGAGTELEYGNVQQAKASGLGVGAIEMGKSFVKKTIEDLFSGELGEFVPPGTTFRLTRGEEGVFTLTASALE